MNAPSKNLHRGLWAVQLLLAALFAMAGAFKTFTPLPDLAAAMPWVADAAPWVPRVAGVSELLGAVGLVAPGLTGIAPKLTAAAAAGLALVMVLAIGMHGMAGDVSALPVNVVLGGLAAFVAWGRGTKDPTPAS